MVIRLPPSLLGRRERDLLKDMAGRSLPANRRSAGRMDPDPDQVLWDMSVRTPSTTKSTSFVET